MERKIGVINMKFEFNDGFLLAGGKVIAEISALEENSIDTLFDSKMSAGVSRIISEKKELHVKYDRLLKEYELARHECKLRDEHIDKLEEKQEELLGKISALQGECQRLYEENLHISKSCGLAGEKLDAIRNIISTE
jgi:predicted nuclease with TOPRIM domain